MSGSVERAADAANRVADELALSRLNAERATLVAVLAEQENAASAARSRVVQVHATRALGIAAAIGGAWFLYSGTLQHQDGTVALGFFLAFLVCPVFLAVGMLWPVPTLPDQSAGLAMLAELDEKIRETRSRLG